MKSANIIFFAAILVLLSACTSAKRKEQTISISGAFALYPLVVQWAGDYQKENPDIRFNISAGGAGKGMADALSGTVDLGMFSRAISKEEIAQGTWWVGLTIDAVLPTISDKNPCLENLKARGIRKGELAAIFLDGTVNDWAMLCQVSKKLPITVYTRSDACGAAGTWAQYLGANQENLSGIGIYGDPGLAEAVSNDASAIGFNNTIYIYDIRTGAKRPGIEVIPLDLNEDGHINPEEDFYDSFSQVLAAISDGRYPSPPARELYFVAKGKPVKKAVLDFIAWTLSKGQAHVASAGYVPLDEEKIQGYLNKLK